MVESPRLIVTHAGKSGIRDLVVRLKLPCEFEFVETTKAGEGEVVLLNAVANELAKSKAKTFCRELAEECRDHLIDSWRGGDRSELTEVKTL